MVATLRPPRPDEATAIAAAINEHSQIVNGADSVTPDVVSYWFTIPELDPDHDVLVAEAPSGKLVGYADVNNGGTSKTRFWIDLHLLPDAGAEVGDALVEALERRARERAEVGAVVRGMFAERDDLARRVFAARGYELVRHSLRMRRSLAEEPETPDWPESLAVQTADAGNLEPVWRAVEEGFADHWEHEKQPWDDFLHLTTAPDHDFALWFLAVEGDEIAGACLCNPHEWGDRSAGHVNSLSVRPRWRRRGLALAMLLHSFRELRTRGREHVTLFVDAENTTGAVRLYHRAGMHIDQQQDIWNRPLA